MLPLLSGMIARVLLAAALLGTLSGCAWMPKPTRDQLMLMEQGYGLSLDAVEAATAAGHLDDKQRRDKVRVALGQAQAAITEARNLARASGGPAALAADSTPVTRYEAAHGRLKAALAEGEAEAARQAAARERRSNEFLNELFGAPSARPPGGAQP